MRVNSKKLNSKISVWLSAIVFVLSMLPIWYLAFYAAPMGDDLGYGTLTHQTWLATHSVIEVLKAALETSRSFYQTWNGDWFTVFLFALMPEVFASGTYWITAILFTIFFSIALTLFLYEICVKLLGMEKSLFIVLNCLVLFLSFQFVPSLSIMSYWYVGAVHYIYPHVFMLLALREPFNFLPEW